MNMQELHSHAHAGAITELNLISLEGGIYILHAEIDGETHPLNDADGQAVHLRSVDHARHVLKDFPTLEFNLVHAVVHDEMCGLSDGTQETLKVPMPMGPGV